MAKKRSKESNAHQRREYLAKYLGERIEFIARVTQFGEPQLRWKFPPIGFPEKNVLITDIYSPVNRIRIDHIWLPYTDEMSRLHVDIGTNIRFTAEVVEYQKYLIDDYTLGDPRNIRVLSKLMFQIS